MTTPTARYDDVYTIIVIWHTNITIVLNVKMIPTLVYINNKRTKEFVSTIRLGSGKLYIIILQCYIKIYCIYLIFFVCVFACMCMHAMVWMWRSEDILHAFTMYVEDLSLLFRLGTKYINLLSKLVFLLCLYFSISIQSKTSFSHILWTDGFILEEGF